MNTGKILSQYKVCSELVMTVEVQDFGFKIASSNKIELSAKKQ